MFFLNTIETPTVNRVSVRYLVAALAALAALIYYLIGLEVLTIVDTTVGEGDFNQREFGLMAGTMFAVGALLLLTIRRRIVWAIGAILQVMVITMYFIVASERTPAFEMWGITLRVIQVFLLVGLVYLVMRPGGDKPGAVGRR